MLALKALFWLTLGALLWTHLLYPLGAAALARVRMRAVRKAGIDKLDAEYCRADLVLAGHGQR